MTWEKIKDLIPNENQELTEEVRDIIDLTACQFST